MTPRVENDKAQRQPELHSQPRSEASVLSWIALHPAQFALQVVRAFMSHQGFLLAGAVAYYTLLSIVPLFSLFLVALSRLVDEQQLLSMIEGLLNLMLASEVPALTSQFQDFLDHSTVISGFGIVVMLVSSSLAFGVLEKCMAVIFFHRAQVGTRPFFVSVAMPYVFIVVLGVGLLVVTVVGTIVQASHIPAIDSSGLLLYGLGVLGLMLLLSAVYFVIPVGRLSFKHALLGGVSAGLLWEIARHLMVWYFRTLSTVNLVYGTFATAVLALLSLEVAAVIFLLGAQVIAEFERLMWNGIPDHGAPDPSRA